MDHQSTTLKLLASKGARLDVCSETGTTLAHIAARDGDHACLQILCEGGADVDATNQLGSTPLMFAAAAGDTKVSSCTVFLIVHGYDCKPEYRRQRGTIEQNNIVEAYSGEVSFSVACLK